MIDGNRQQKEIETIKPRTLQLNLSDADCNRISEKAGALGITVAELLQSFIGDLVDGTYTNGSDERMKANEYVDRCWFGMFPEDTFLRHLIEWGELDSLLEEYEFMNDMKDNIEITTKELEDKEAWKGFEKSDGTPYYKSLEEWEDSVKEEIESYKEDYENSKACIKKYYDDYIDGAPDQKENYEDAIKKVMDYVKDLEAFKGVEE